MPPFAAEAGADFVADPPASQSPTASAEVSAEKAPPDAQPERRGRRRTERDDGSASAGGARPAGRKRSLVPLLGVGVVVVAGGIGGLAWKIAADRRDVAERRKHFLDEAAPAAPGRDPRRALNLGKALPESVQKDPQIQSAISSLETDVKELDARDAATRALAAAGENASPEERLKAADASIACDRNYAPAFLVKARARLALGRRGGSKAYAEARAAAAQDLNEVLRCDPKAFEASWELANLADFTPQGRESTRRNILEGIRQSDVDGCFGALATARLRGLLGDYRAAIEEAGTAINRRGDFPLPYLIRGRLKLVTGDRTGALRDGDAALEHGGQRDPEVLVFHSAARRAASNDELGARADLDKAVEIDSTWAPAWGLRALLRCEAGDAGWREDAEKALAIDDHEPRALLAEAEAIGLEKPTPSARPVKDGAKRAKARDYLDAAIERDDTFVLALQVHARIAIFDQNYDDATRDCDRILRVEPQNARALGNRGVIYMKQKETEKAQHELDHAIELEPNLEVALVARAQLYLEGEPKRPEDAIRDLTRALRLQQDNPEAYFLRGWARYTGSHGKSDPLGEAMNDLTTALSTTEKGSSWIPTAYLIRGLCHNGRGEWSEAIADFNEAERLAPANSGSHDIELLRKTRASAQENLAKAAQKTDDAKKPDDEKKPDEKKPDEKKPDEKKPDEKKPDDKKPDPSPAPKE
jgi:tetratricopeptide (TPR) repeat protein